MSFNYFTNPEEIKRITENLLKKLNKEPKRRLEQWDFSQD